MKWLITYIKSQIKWRENELIELQEEIKNFKEALKELEEKS